MWDALHTLSHLAVVVTKLLGRGGIRAVIAEDLLPKYQLLILRRPRRRVPNLTTNDRFLFGFVSLFLSPGRIRNVAVVLRPSTLIKFHEASVRRKCRRLFSSSHRPKKLELMGPSDQPEFVTLDIKSRNPRFGCPRIAMIISRTFSVEIDANIVYRVLSKHHGPLPRGKGPSWLSFIGHTQDSLWSVDLFR